MLKQKSLYKGRDTTYINIIMIIREIGISTSGKKMPESLRALWYYQNSLTPVLLAVIRAAN
jgi:hypothetical protein